MYGLTLWFKKIPSDEQWVAYKICHVYIWTIVNQLVWYIIDTSNEIRYYIVLIKINNIFLGNVYENVFASMSIDASLCGYPDSKVHGANMGPTWVLPAPDGPHVGPMNLAIRVCM